jgi:hypothetical protein
VRAGVPRPGCRPRGVGSASASGRATGVLRLVNEVDSDHPMHQPFHIRGAGRVVVVARNGVPEANLVWKDTVLVRIRARIDILLDVTNRSLDGALPHRGAPRGRDDVQLQCLARRGGLSFCELSTATPAHGNKAPVLGLGPQLETSRRKGTK